MFLKTRRIFRGSPAEDIAEEIHVQRVAFGPMAHFVLRGGEGIHSCSEATATAATAATDTDTAAQRATDAATWPVLLSIALGGPRPYQHFEHVDS